VGMLPTRGSPSRRVLAHRSVLAPPHLKEAKWQRQLHVNAVADMGIPFT
jgi:hypothetical protein